MLLTSLTIFPEIQPVVGTLNKQTTDLHILAHSLYYIVEKYFETTADVKSDTILKWNSNTPVRNVPEWDDYANKHEDDDNISPQNVPDKYKTIMIAKSNGTKNLTGKVIYHYIPEENVTTTKM